MTMIERAAKAIYPHPNVDWDDARTISKLALLAALDAEEIKPLIKEKIRVHYWNHHGARDPSPEYVDDLSGMIAIAIRSLVQGASQ